MVSGSAQLVDVDVECEGEGEGSLQRVNLGCLAVPVRALSGPQDLGAVQHGRVSICDLMAGR